MYGLLTQLLFDSVLRILAKHQFLNKPSEQLRFRVSSIRNALFSHTLNREHEIVCFAYMKNVVNLLDLGSILCIWCILCEDFLCIAFLVWFVLVISVCL